MIKKIVKIELPFGASSRESAKGQNGFSIVLFYRDVSVYILATNEAVVENVGKHGNNEPVACDVAGAVGDEVLDERHDTTTHNHGHEETRSSCCVLAKALNSEVEDAAPHH